jgi:hypothetical protein
MEWCGASVDQQRRVSAFITTRYPRLSALVETCESEAQATPVTRYGNIIDHVLHWGQGDALDDTESTRARVMDIVLLSELVHRCVGDWRRQARDDPELMLSEGEALLCSALSPKWAEEGLSRYWPELSHGSEST